MRLSLVCSPYLSPKYQPKLNTWARVRCRTLLLTFKHSFFRALFLSIFWCLHQHLKRYFNDLLYDNDWLGRIWIVITTINILDQKFVNYFMSNVTDFLYMNRPTKFINSFNLKSNSMLFIHKLLSISDFLNLISQYLFMK